MASRMTALLLVVVGAGSALYLAAKYRTQAQGCTVDASGALATVTHGADTIPGGWGTGTDVVCTPSTDPSSSVCACHMRVKP